MPTNRCAIYVRKSTEHGLELEFNSLQNQEESCKAYIASQAFNGWQYYKTYTDAALSGGTMDRPALKQMLDDMAHGLVNTVVVYKVDRLSRSILDFHKMMQYFDKYNANFVSITQSFDTSNAMGKLTLNMLLSFAQFEREVASERVKDKMRATKAKGMWVGGRPTLGYNIEHKKLVVNTDEAETVRKLFEKYTELQSVVELTEYARANNICNKRWITKDGVSYGGGVLHPNILHRILRDKIYIGKIENKATNEVFDGEHQAIIDKDWFNKVQVILQSNANTKHRDNRASNNLLSGKLFNSDGTRFVNQKTTKSDNCVIYYYATRGLYMQATPIDETVGKAVTDFLNSDMTMLPDNIKTRLKQIDIKSMQYAKRYDCMRTLIHRVVYDNNRLTIFITTDNPDLIKYASADYINHDNTYMDYSINDNMVIIKREIIVRNTRHKNVFTVSENNRLIVRAFATAFQYRDLYEQGKTVHASSATLYRYLKLAYADPRIVNQAMNGELRCSVDELFKIAASNLL